MSTIDSDGQAEQGNSLYAALARTLTRSVALYFSRPVRLFRPSKVSGWMFLQGLASQKGVSLSPKFIRHLVKKHGLFVLPRHFIPPLAVNAVLGTVLWETYSETTNFLEGRMSYPLAISLLSGAVAGGAQAVVAAPAENVRLVLEGGGNHAGWSSAWRDVFLGRQPEMDISKAQNLREARQVRQWMKEVGEMAGRGWFGFGWGFCKDVCGFAIFFSIFELTRRTALTLKSKSLEVINALEDKQAAKSHVPRVVHGMTLVGGGVLAGLAYEMSSRPFDLTRRIVHTQHVTDPKHSTAGAVLRILTEKARDDGILSFFRAAPVHESAGPAQSTSVCRRRMFSMLRVLGRVGPWGAGFLMWEAFGPGLS